MTKYQILSHGWADAENCQSLRRNVFIEEQCIDENEEWDEEDPYATHFSVLDSENKPLAAARLTRLGQIGRVCVGQQARRQGIATELLLFIINYAQSQGHKTLFLNAQLYTRPLYHKLGFITQGEVFLEAGIQHQRMELSNVSKV